MSRTRRPYPSDLSGEEWALLEFLRVLKRRGRPPKWPARLVADGVFYLLRSGCAWGMLEREPEVEIGLMSPPQSCPQDCHVGVLGRSEEFPEVLARNTPRNV